MPLGNRLVPNELEKRGGDIAAPEDISVFGGDETAKVRVWDPFVRASHWLVFLLVAVLLLTGFRGDQENHLALGIDILVIVLGRIAWGFVGEGHARFSDFVVGPRRFFHYAQSIVRGHPQRYLGHNPAGGWMVVFLLATLMVLACTGLVLQAELEFDGWLVGLLHLSDAAVLTLLHVHQLAVWTLLTLIPLHLIGVFLAGVQHKENLVVAMLNGEKAIRLYDQEIP